MMAMIEERQNDGEMMERQNDGEMMERHRHFKITGLSLGTAPEYDVDR
jgi:hypothetical protein